MAVKFKDSGDRSHGGSGGVLLPYRIGHPQLRTRPDHMLCLDCLAVRLLRAFLEICYPRPLFSRRTRLCPSIWCCHTDGELRYRLKMCNEYGDGTSSIIDSWYRPTSTYHLLPTTYLLQVPPLGAAQTISGAAPLICTQTTIVHVQGSQNFSRAWVVTYRIAAVSLCPSGTLYHFLCNSPRLGRGGSSIISWLDGKTVVGTYRVLCAHGAMHLYL